MLPPLVYCETNWLVALAFPHHQSHGAAVKLRADAKMHGVFVLRHDRAVFVERP